MTRSASEQPVIVGVDGSDLATVALAWGVDEARRRSCPLRIVHAALETARMAGQPTLDEAARKARQAVSDLDVSTVLDTGDPAELLLKQASGAYLVVLGSRGRSDFSSMLHSSTSLQVAMHAPCPVVVIRLAGEDAPPGPSAGRVVVGLDETPRSERAIDFAFDQADRRGIGLTAVLTWLSPEFDSSASPSHEWEQAATDEQAMLADRLAGHREKHPEVDVVQKAVREDPEAALIDESRGAELIVVGSHGRGGLGGVMRGSVSHALLHHAHCPVAVVRTH